MNIPFDTNPLWQHLASPWAYRLSLALLHFLWQGVVIALLAALAMRIIGRRSPHRRYAIGLAGLLAMSVAPVVTFFLVTPPAPPLQFVASAVPAGQPQDLAALGSNELTVEINRLDALIAHLETQLDETAAPPTPLPRTTSESSSWWNLLQQSQPYLLLGWLVGTTICSLRLAIGAQASWRYRWGKKPLPEQTREILIRVTKRLGVRTPRVFVSERVLEALVVGLFRPMILLPAAWIGKIPPELLEAVLAHEIAHLRRHDLWINLAQRCLETLLFYHPALWWLSRRVRQEREYCCDEIAARTLDCRAAYARALEFVAAERLLAGRLATLNTALVANMGGEEMALLNRVRRVLGSDPVPDRFRWLSATGTVLLLPLCLWAAFLWADDLALADGKAKKPVVAAQQSDKPETPSLTADDFGTSPETDPAPLAAETEPAEIPAGNPFRLTKPDDNDQELQRLKEQLKAAKTANEALLDENKLLRKQTHELYEQFVAIKKDQRYESAGVAVLKNGPPAKEPSPTATLFNQFEYALGELEREVEDEADIEEIDAQVEKLFDKLREELKELSPAGEVPRPAETIKEPAPNPKQTDEPTSLRVQYEQALLRQLEALKKQKANHRKFAQKLIEKGAASEDQLAKIDLEYDQQIVEILGKLLELKKQTETRDSTSKYKLSLSDILSAEQDHTVTVPFAEIVDMTPSPTPIAKATITENVVSSHSLQNGKYHLELNAKEKTATVIFFEPTLGLTIHVETPLEKLPELLQRLSKRRSEESSPAEPLGPAPSPSRFGTPPEHEPPSEPPPAGNPPPSTNQGFQPPTEESPFMEREESETSNLS